MVEKLVIITMSIRSLLMACAAFLLLGALGASAATHFVWTNSPSPSAPYANWDTAARTIQQAIDVSLSGDTVWVTNGTYAIGAVLVNGELSNRVALTKAVTVRSVNGPALTIIEGHGPNGENAVRCAYVTNGATLSGFMLTNGATRVSGDSLDLKGGGVLSEAGGVVSNCWILNNTSSYLGGGAYGGTLNDCMLTGNVTESGGGGASGSTLNSCTLSGNSSGQDGGGAYGCTLNRCTLRGNVAANSGGGSRNSTLNSCIISGNSAQVGAGGVNGGTLNNCTLVGNSAPFAGGSYGGTLNNCTICGNSADSYAGGADRSTLNNCIVYHNIASSDPNYWEGTLSHCCTTPSPGGVGNITNDPRLVSASHIAVDSPCRGAGSLAYTPATDADGEPWRNAPAIGADEPYANSTGMLVVAIEAPFVHVAAGFSTPLTARIDGPVTTSAWDYGDGCGETNRAFAAHAWSVGGSYAVVLKAWNADHPEGVMCTVTVSVATQSVYHVNAASATPAAPYHNWATAAKTIQAAIDVCAAGATILVTNGLYQTGGRAIHGTMTNRVALTNAVTVRSVNGPQATVIQGDSPKGDNAVRCAYLDVNCVLAGFTLRNGATRTQGDYHLEGCGGGVWCKSGAQVIDCWLDGNVADNLGGGAYRGILTACTLSGNTAQLGGGAWGSTLNTCVLSGNSAINGGGAEGGTLNSCVVYGNSASSVGGGSAGSAVNNCTISHNQAGTMGGGAYGGVANNSIVYFNIAPTAPNYVNSNGKMNYCCATPMPPQGIGNMTNDPCFVATNDLHLTAESPCIDRGNNASVAGAEDMDRRIRIVNGIVDIGAFEFDGGLGPFFRWLQSYGLPIDGSANTADPDGDGMNNWAEYQAGTNPTNSASVLGLQSIDALPSEGIVVRWSSVPDRYYNLYRATNLMAGTNAFVLLPGASNLPASPTVNSYTDSVQGVGPAYYRIGVHQ